MMQASESALIQPVLPRAPQVSYRMADARTLLGEPGTLAVFAFGAGAPFCDDPRYVRVALESFDAPAPMETWQIDATVSHGEHGALRWSSGGGWLFTAIELDERQFNGAEEAAQFAYATLRQFVSERAEQRVLRIWNYLGAINSGDGDDEHYKQFCHGRAIGNGDFFAEGFPAATAIGHHGDPHLLQIYLLASTHGGTAIENPRQTSAWHYPRQYGRTSPGFARAMMMPAQDLLAISGTAAVVGHASAHEGDLDAQLDETLTNLEALLTSAGMAAGFDTHSPLKTYVRRSTDAPRVREFLQQRLPGVPVLVMHGDVCRKELLVEIDGWRYS